MPKYLKEDLPADLQVDEFNALLDQVCKDLMFIREEMTVNNVQELYSAVKSWVDYCLEKNPDRFFSSLYRVDIPENFSSHLLKEENGIENISKAILVRELLKVRLRKKYSS